MTCWQCDKPHSYQGRLGAANAVLKMVATEFLGYIQSFSATTYIGVEDLADRANFQWNVIVLLISMILVTVRQYFMAPLVCYLPTTVSGGNAESYVTNLCWVEGTFPINLTSGVVPHDIKEWSSTNPRIMNYYQWVPLVLGLQAIIYYVPRIIWSIFTYNKTGTDLQSLIRTADSAAKDDGEKREKAVRHMAKSLELLLFNRREYHYRRDGRLARVLQFLPGKRHGNNLIYYYIFIKILYVAIGIAQLYLMYTFLRFDKREGYLFFGWKILDDIRRGRPWTETQVFPRIGACRHTLQHVAAGNNLFAQCVLPINMLNEKIYIFLYFFLAGVLLFTVVSIPLWVFRISKYRQRHFVKRFLKMADVYNRDDQQLKDLIDRFINEFLRQDGHFLLRMLSMNAGDLITVEIVCCLFGNYRKQFFGKDFRGQKKEKANEYGDPQKSGNIPKSGPYSSSPTSEGDFMSMKLQPGGYASSKHRPLPTAPPEDSPPYPQDEEELQKASVTSPYPKLPDNLPDINKRLTPVRSSEKTASRRDQQEPSFPPMKDAPNELKSSNV
uniref:Innexin n=1 Tax=Echinococcus granulosus TaxID=6210 RepID=A0A068WI48_ECHGR|nr:innexin unc 9 [Echinococcus granulosus]